MRRGFTLLEMLVAIGLFVVVTFIAVGSLLIISSAQKKAFFVQTNQDNVRFALEAVAREIRTGIRYSTDDTLNQEPAGNVFCNPPQCGSVGSVVNCVTTGGATGSCLKFVNADLQLVVIKLSHDTSLNGECGAPPGTASISCITRSTTSIPRGSGLASQMQAFQPVTAPEVHIDSFQLIVTGQGTDASDTHKPRVTIIVRAVTPGVDPRQSRLDAQTTVSQIDPEPKT